MASPAILDILGFSGLTLCTIGVGKVLSCSLFDEVRKAGKEVYFVETLALSAGLGASVVVFLGLILGYAGVFSLMNLIILLACCFVFGFYWSQPLTHRFGFGRLTRSDFAVLLICGALLSYATVMRSHEIQGMRDQGVYTCTGIQLARTEAFFWNDRLVSLLGFEPVSHLFEDLGDILQGRPRFLRFAGYYLSSAETGRVVPQFLHGYEVWMAIAYLVGGPQATQCVNGVFAALGVLLFYCVVRRIVSARTALIAALLLAASLPQVWYSRFPSNEPLLQVLVWAAILVYVLLGDGQVAACALRRSRVHSLLPLAVPLAAATTVKFAFWPSLSIFAFEGGLRARQRDIRSAGKLLWLTLVIVASAAYIHAALFANYYLYGSWTFTIKRLGISFEMFPLLFVGGVAGAFSLGMILSDYSELLSHWWRRYRRWLSVAVVVLIAGACLYQWHVFSSGNNLEVWGERTNLYEFAQYYGLPVFALALYGYWLWLSGNAVQRSSRLLGLLTIAAMVFIIKRNLDALHPWASRRWLPVLVPSTAFALALALSRLSAMLPRWNYGCAVLAALAVCGLQLRQAPVLITIPNYRGAIPQVDQWAGILRADDLVLLEPSAVVAQYGPYLASRFDVQGYVQRNSPEFWARTKDVAALTRENFKRTIYVTDEDLSRSGRPCAKLLATSKLDYPVVLETLHRLPVAPTQIRETIRFYEIDWASMPEGWWTQWTPKAQPRAPQQPPIRVEMGEDAEPYLMGGFFDVTDQPNAPPYRWTNGTARIAIGKLLSFPLSRGTVQLKAVIHSGRSVPMDVHWYLNMHDPSRAKKLGVTTARPEWSECKVEVPAAWLSPESVLDLQSLRPAVSVEIPAGILGFRIQELRIE